MSDTNLFADALTAHFPRDMMGEDGQEWQECACGFRFEEPQEWAQHAAERIAANTTEEG